MAKQTIQSRLRRLRRYARRNKHFLTGVLVLVMGLIGYTSYIENQRLSVNPVSYRPLLSLIARAESNDNYNAYFGNAHNTELDFTLMSIRQVIDWQASYTKQGSPSDAVGKYQIISPTLAELVAQLNIDPSERFDAKTQDRLAMTLIERRGAIAYVNQEIDREQFAANLAKEWAALPKVIGDHPSQSYYAGDGLNKSRVEVDSVLRAIDPITAQ